MPKTFTPVQIEILLHCYYCATPVPRHDAPAIAKALRLFMHYDFIRPGDAPGVYRTTTKGDEFVDRLMVAAYSIAKRVNKGVDVVKPTDGIYGASNWSGPEFIRRFEAGEVDRSGAMPRVSFVIKPGMSEKDRRRFVILKPNTFESLDATDYAKRPPDGIYSASIKVDRETGEKIKDFVAAAFGATPLTEEDREWMTPGWMRRFDSWQKYLARRGIVGAFRRRLLDMVFAKTDKLRDAEMHKAIARALRETDPWSYAGIRRVILDTRKPKK